MEVVFAGFLVAFLVATLRVPRREEGRFLVALNLVAAACLPLVVDFVATHVVSVAQTFAESLPEVSSAHSVAPRVAEEEEVDLLRKEFENLR